MEAPTRSLGVEIPASQNVQQAAPQETLRLAAAAERALQNIAAVKEKHILRDPSYRAKLIAQFDQENEKNKNLFTQIQSGNLDYASMMALFSQFTIDKYKIDAIDLIIYRLVKFNDIAHLIEFISPFPETKRNSLLFQKANDIIYEARQDADCIWRGMQGSLQQYIDNYNKTKHVLDNAIKTVISVYPLINDVCIKFSFIQLLYSSAIHFPEIPVIPYPVFYIATHIPEYRLSQEHNTLLERSRQNYQAYVAQKTKDLFLGLDGTIITYQEFLKIESEDTHYPAANAAYALRVIFDKLIYSRREYQKQTEDLTRPIHQFKEAETARIKDEIINYVIAFHIQCNDLRTLFALISMLFSVDRIPRILLRAAEISIEKRNSTIFQAIFAEMMLIKDQYPLVDQPKVEAVIIRGAALAIKSNNQALAEQLLKLLPEKIEEIKELSRIL